MNNEKRLSQESQSQVLNHRSGLAYLGDEPGIAKLKVLSIARQRSSCNKSCQKSLQCQLMFFKKPELTAGSRPILQQDEQLLFVQNAVGLYEK